MKINKKIIIITTIIVLAILTVIVIIVSFQGSQKQTQEKIYNIGETIKTEEWEMTLTDVQYGKKLANNVSYEDFCLPKEDGSNQAQNGNTFICITYDIKFLGKNNTDLRSGFVLDYDNGYIIEDSHNYAHCFYIKNDTVQKSKSGILELWNSNYQYTFKPLEDKKTIREYIEVPDKIINDEDNKSILLLKWKEKGLIYKIK